MTIDNTIEYLHKMGCVDWYDDWNKLEHKPGTLDRGLLFKTTHNYFKYNISRDDDKLILYRKSFNGWDLISSKELSILSECDDILKPLIWSNI